MVHRMQQINKALVEVFNDVLIIEENILRQGVFHDVSVKEVHTIEAIGLYDRKTMSEVAAILRITVGTLTVAIKNLVKKGYVERQRCEDDKRVVKVHLTKKGKLLYRVHDNFHYKMVKQVIGRLSEEEETALLNAVTKFHVFFKEQMKL